MFDDEVMYCSEEGCGAPAVGERFVGLTYDGFEIVEAVCYEHTPKPE